MLAPGWEALDGGADGTYYFCEATGETTWDMPLAPAAAGGGDAGVHSHAP